MRLLISALLTCGFALAAHGQQPSAKKESKAAPKLAGLPLEELLAEALKHNPDIRSAEAKVRESEAELNRIRLGVMQKLTKAYSDLELRRLSVKEAKARYDRATALQQGRAISAEELAVAKFTFSKAEAEVAELEAQLPYLVGKGQTGFFVELGAEGALHWLDPRKVRVWDFDSETVKMDSPRGSLAEKLRKVLDTPITGEWKDTPLEEIVAFFGAKFEAEQINFFGDRVKLSIGGGYDRIAPKKTPVETRKLKTTMQIKQPLPLAAALQFFEDHLRDQFGKRVRFVIREYGVVLADPDSLPPGAVFVVDFWKNRLSK